MAATLVAADLDLPADVGLDLATEVTLDLEVGFDLVTELDQLLVAQGVDARVRVDPGRGEQLLGAGTADAVDVGKCDLDALVAREVNNNKACNVYSFSGSRWSGRVASRVATPAPAIRSGGDSALRAVPSDHVVDLYSCGALGLSPGAACDAGSRRSP